MDVEVVTGQGRVTGRRDGEVSSFRGIPYASAPCGSLRFAPPRAPEPGDVDARGWGATVSTPPQRSAAIAELLPEPKRPGAQPLNLNVWTSDLAGRSPVLVWIHGGGFVTGTGSTAAFDGGRLCTRGLVVVTINYRLAVEGFVAIEGCVPNRGLLDQIAALEWVRDNIAHFGGDPAQVTVAGESAGAMSVITLLAMPRARGLFRRAIAQSGAGHHVHSRAEAEHVAAELSGELGVAMTPETLAGVPDSRLYAALNSVLDRLPARPAPEGMKFSRLGVQPVVDGDLLPDWPLAAIRAGAGTDVDLLVGTNSHEYGLFVEAGGLAPRLDEPTMRSLVARLGTEVEALLPAYRRHLATDAPATLYEALQSDWFAVVPMLRLLEARAAASASTHVYEFVWQPDTFEGRLGACHTIEVPFVFDTLDAEWGRRLRGEAPQTVADLMAGVWSSFVRTGDPGWPADDPRTHPVARLSDRVDVVPDPHQWRAAIWDGLIPTR
ncbi:carboxylesterase/lipase family protein [Gordonia terrae]|uniref:carboxylesterase/lipase family protein n=1 Tax=Gordonia terrae TaxID=2055 RepID=UPI003F6B208A